MPSYNDPMESAPNDQNWWDTLKKAGNTALWLMDRPQQAIFRGAQAGSKDFEKSLHRGHDPFSAAIGSLPNMASGMWQGLTGDVRDVRGRDLVEGLSQFHEWAPEELIGTALDITASPTDVVSPFGKLAKLGLVSQLAKGRNRRLLQLERGLQRAPETKLWQSQIGNLVWSPEGVKYGGKGMPSTYFRTASEAREAAKNAAITASQQQQKAASMAHADALNAIRQSVPNYDFIEKIPTSPIGMGRRAMTYGMLGDNPLPPEYENSSGSRSGAPFPYRWEPRPKVGDETLYASQTSGYRPWEE